MAASLMNSAQSRSQLVSRRALNNKRTAFGRVGPQRQVKAFAVLPEELRQKEFVPEYPNEFFIQATLAAFPEEKAIANSEEARCLYENGWTYLDVRPALEVQEVGKVKNSVNIPMGIAKYVYNSETRERVVQKSDNPDFIKMMQKRFPKKDVKLIVACSDGRAYSLDALEALDEAGYENLVGLKGGYYAWFRTWDNKLNRRRFGEYSEQYTHDGDSCGIHASGAGFERVDSIEAWRPPKF